MHTRSGRDVLAEPGFGSGARWRIVRASLLIGIAMAYAWVALALVWPLPFVGALLVAGLVVLVAVWQWRVLLKRVRLARRPVDLDFGPAGESRWKRRERRAMWVIVGLTLALVVAAVLAGLHWRLGVGFATREAYLYFSLGLGFVAWLPLIPVANWLTTNRRRRLFARRRLALEGLLRDVEKEQRRRDSD